MDEFESRRDRNDFLAGESVGGDGDVHLAAPGGQGVFQRKARASISPGEERLRSAGLDALHRFIAKLKRR